MKHLLWLLFFLSAVTFANSWKIDLASSQLDVMSVKKDKIAEHHQFKNFSGILNKDGSFTVEVDLTSLETNIPIRNERIQKLMFETNNFAKATLSGTFDLTNVSNEKQTSADIDATLDLHGKKQQIKLAVSIMQNKQGLWVSSRHPLMLNTFAFGLDVGVTKLQEVAKLPRIDFIVPVTFNTLWVK